jgi:hypothetical protein
MYTHKSDQNLGGEDRKHNNTIMYIYWHIFAICIYTWGSGKKEMVREKELKRKSQETHGDVWHTVWHVSHIGARARARWHAHQGWGLVCVRVCVFVLGPPPSSPMGVCTQIDRLMFRYVHMNTSVHTCHTGTYVYVCTYVIHVYIFVHEYTTWYSIFYIFLWENVFDMEEPL